MVFPLINSLRLSFFEIGAQNQMSFNGGQNYVKLFTDSNFAPFFWRALKNNFIFFAVHMLVQNPIGLLLAALLAEGGRIRNFFRTIIFMPTRFSRFNKSFGTLAGRSGKLLHNYFLSLKPRLFHFELARARFSGNFKFEFARARVRSPLPNDRYHTGKTGPGINFAITCSYSDESVRTWFGNRIVRQLPGLSSRRIEIPKWHRADCVDRALHIGRLQQLPTS